MNKQQKKIRTILEDLSKGNLSPEQAFELLQDRGYEDLGFARVDHERKQRCGFCEVILCTGKTPDQVAAIGRTIYEKHGALLATRAEPDVFTAVQNAVPDAQYNELARTVTALREEPQRTGMVHIITGGTSDIPAAEEAAETASIMGRNTKKLYDVGVAGIHRLLNNADFFEDAEVVIAVAGMEGALPSVAGGLVNCPVIAVPTSVGYGASFGGAAALLGMLNSCASNVLVTNIDNGFRAGYVAALMTGGKHGR